jgi:hypothetical protein
MTAVLRSSLFSNVSLFVELARAVLALPSTYYVLITL